MVLAARRNKCGICAIELLQLKAQHAAVKIKSALQVRYFAVDMAQVWAGADGRDTLGHNVT
jgi:hypothetical protein